MNSKSYPCPACGHLVFEAGPGSEDICLVCLWEDDAAQLRWPDLAGGANAVSLRVAQKNVTEFGAIEQRFAGDVRPPGADEPRDPHWRPVDERDTFEVYDEDAAWPSEPTALYYWLRPSSAGDGSRAP